MANYNSAGLVSSLIVPATQMETSQGIVLRNLSAHSTKITAQYIQIFDTTSVPANGAVPIMTYPIGVNITLNLDFGNGRQFLNGVTICNSSTAATLTIGTADCLIDVQTKVEWWK